MQRLVKLITPVIIGEVYLVPCVEFENEIWPVMGIEHSDPILGPEAAIQHHHVDHRFVTEKQLTMVGCSLTTISPNFNNLNISYKIPAILCDIKSRKIKELPKVCLREMPSFRPPEEKIKAGWKFQVHAGKTTNHFGRFEDFHENKKLKGKCLTCPHKGIPLGSMEANGNILTCPGHMLDWDKTTGKMIRRTRKTKDDWYEYIN